MVDEGDKALSDTSRTLSMPKVLAHTGKVWLE